MSSRASCIFAVAILLTTSHNIIYCYTNASEICRNGIISDESCLMTLFPDNYMPHRAFWMKPKESFESLTIGIPPSYGELDRNFGKKSFDKNKWNQVFYVLVPKENKDCFEDNKDVDIGIFIEGEYWFKIHTSLQKSVDPRSPHYNLTLHFKGETEFLRSYSDTKENPIDSLPISYSPIKFYVIISVLAILLFIFIVFSTVMVLILCKMKREQKAKKNETYIYDEIHNYAYINPALIR